ncbi:hypothetical protein AB0H18_34770 [Streptomyces sp. NPDC020766]|uniref:hypothetical protein n=1 Tax=Streptomyces sp. NPDC020766 TaxID=3155011 RepID=UPI0033F3EEB8
MRMPPRLTEEFTRVCDQHGDFPGRVIDTARLRAMLTNPARTYYPGVLNDCYCEASTALCLSRRPSAEPEAAPVMNHRQPAKYAAADRPAAGERPVVAEKAAGLVRLDLNGDEVARRCRR